MTMISSISEFLLQAGVRYQIYDMSRTIARMPDQAFMDFEQGSQPHPAPRQQQGWFGIVFCNPQMSSQHYIWFVKLPLDEESKLVCAARDQFLQIIVEALATNMQDKEADKSLPDNPYSFTPTQQQLADFNSISRHALQLPPSQYFQPVSDYIKNKQWSQWQQLGIQGISDLVVYADRATLNQFICQELHLLPDTLASHLLQSLENQTLAADVITALCNWNKKQSDPRKLATGLRALHSASATEQVSQLLIDILHSPTLPDIDVLIVIAGRLWPALSNTELCHAYFEAAVTIDPTYQLFSGLFADLVAIPALRGDLMRLLRSPNKSSALQGAIGHLFSGRS